MFAEKARRRMLRRALWQMRAVFRYGRTWLGNGSLNIFSDRGCYDVHCESPYPFPVFSGHQQGLRPAPSGLVGGAEGHRPAGHGGLHPSRLAGGAAGTADARRGGCVRSAEGPAPAPRHDRRAASVRHHRGDQLHLQAGRQDAESPQPDPAALSGGRRRAFRPAGGHRQHPLRWAAHPGPGQPGPASPRASAVSGWARWNGGPDSTESTAPSPS